MSSPASLTQKVSKTTRRFGFRSLSWLWIVVGLALLGYVGYEYASMHFEQRSLTEQWERQNATKATSAYPVPPADELTRLTIPKIGLDAVIVEGTSYRQLKIAPGHIKGTSVPGESGNAVISAHRDTFFRHIYELQKGDDVLVRRSGRVYRFEVTGKKVIGPDDVSILKPTPDTELTLLTCYPIYYVGPAPERLVVFSKLVQDPNSLPSQSAIVGSN